MNGKLIGVVLSILFWVACPVGTFYSQEARDLANSLGIRFGSPLYALEDNDHRQLFEQQVGVATIMTYWKYTTHKQEGEYTWEEPDAAIQIAEQLEVPTHGHPLVWGADTHIPDWVLNKPLNEGETIMLDHITTVVGRYAGTMDAWDVVNEAIEEDGTYRNSYWNRAMTGEYVIKAFREAHTTDPEAELIYNDYGMEINNSKFVGVKSLLSWLQSEDVGLSGLGWQLHVYVDDVLDPAFQLGPYMAEISAMGLKNYITELDIRIPDYSPTQLLRQKEAYKKIVQIFLSNPSHGEYFQTWGLTDEYTWWNDFDPSQTHYPLPFDTVMNKKPAYWGMVEAMAAALGQGSATGSYRIKNVGKSKYLSQTTDQEGAEVNLQDLNLDWTSQQWTVEDGPDATQRLQCDWKDWYLNIGDNVSGATANIYPLNNGWWSMMWFAEAVGNHQFRLKNRWSNLYLTAQTNNQVTIESLSPSSNDQLWLFETLDNCPPNYILMDPVSSGTNMHIQTSDWIKAMSSISSGASVQLSGTNSVELVNGFDAASGSTIDIDLDGCNSGQNFQLANPNANQQTQDLYNYLNTFKDNPNNCLILGQNLGWSFEMYNQTVDALHTQTNQWLGVIGGQMRYTTTEIDYPALVTLYSNWQANGGIVELSMLPDNPWTGGSTWDRSVTDIWKLTTPGESGYDAWRTQLDFYAGILQDMQSAGVTVVWRPLMEMNGDWFWYGYTGSNDAQPFIDLYRDMFDYFTNTKGLNNLIWVYSANMAYTGIPSVDHYYPGNDVVDMTGLDVYQNNIALPIDQYNTMIGIGKPFAFTEFGPDHNNMDGTHDYLSFVNKINTDYPESVYALAWHDWPDHLVAWISNQNYNGAMNLPCVVTRDELGN